MPEKTYYSNLPLIDQWTQGPDNKGLTYMEFQDGPNNIYTVKQYQVFPDAYLQEELGKRNGVNSKIYSWFDNDGNIITSDTTYNGVWYYPRTQKYIELQNRFEGYPRSRDPFNYLNYAK